MNWISSLGPWYSTCLDRNFPAVAVVAVVSAVAAAELYVVLLPVER